MADVNSQFDRLTRTKNGVVYLRPCVDIVCYWTGSVFDRVDGVLDFYRKSLHGLGQSLSFFQTDSMGAPARLKGDSLRLLEFWLTGTKSRRDVYVLQLESSVSADDVSDRAFSFQATEAGEDDASGFVRLMLPAHFGLSNAAQIVELAKSLFQKVDFNFGQAGYALNWNEFGRFPELACETMGAIRKHHPGLDLSDPGSSQYVAEGSIKCINWLTMIGAVGCKRLGGVQALRDRIGAKEVVVHELSRGALVQAGPKPELGDTNRRGTAPCYHVVGKVLAPLRDEEHPPYLTVDGADDEDATLEWLARFDS